MSGGARHQERSGPWTEARVAILRKMWEDGSSGREIALALRTTRNSAIAKANRLGLTRRDASVMVVNMARARHGWKTGAGAVTKARERSAKRDPDKQRPVKSLPVASAIVRRASLPAQPLPKDLPFDHTKARPWLTRAFGECAYPVSGEGADTLSCCLPTGGPAAYCAAHRKLMMARPMSEAQRRNAEKMRQAKAVKMRRAA